MAKKHTYTIPRQNKMPYNEKRPPHWRTLYRVWHNMMYRCYDTEHVDYLDYGGRGLVVQERWHQFKNFYDDVAHLYVEGQTIHRPDNDKGYVEGNVKWATRLEQSKNVRPKSVVRSESQPFNFRRPEAKKKRKKRQLTWNRIIDTMFDAIK